MKEVLYEEQVAIPETLQYTQEWFAGIITSHLGADSQIQEIAPSGMYVAEEAGQYIVPSETLKPHQRMQIYNQQYWWRLIKAMHENFPLVTRLFGYHAFNDTIAIPYLLKYPPNTWTLNQLGERLPKWVEEEYREADSRLIQDSVNLDWAFTSSFLAPQNTPLDLTLLIKDNPDNLLSCKFYLQPHIELFKWEYDLMEFREAFLEKDVEYWTENDFPAMAKGKTYHFVLYRTLTNNIHWKEITNGEYALLSILKQGSSIEAACDFLEAQADLYEQAVTNLQGWLQDWVSRQWLTQEC